MLDAIAPPIRRNHGLFARLTSEEQPAITFQLLDLKNFGLSDDLYIKMNARGKPLTPFETFKARYEQELAGQFNGVTRHIGKQKFSIAEFVARRMDTTWADLSGIPGPEDPSLRRGYHEPFSSGSSGQADPESKTSSRTWLCCATMRIHLLIRRFTSKVGWIANSQKL